MSTPKRLPIVTLLLIAGSIGGAFAATIDPTLAVRLGFRPEAPTFQGALASLFLHQNLVHLLGNMVFLAAVGATVEQLSGTLRLALVYFLSGIAGVLAHTLLAARGVDAPPLVGASGAIAGCAAYYSFRYLQVKVPMAPRVGASIAVVTVIWLGLQVIGAFVTIGEERPATAFWAHIGGFVAGLILSFALKAPDLGHLLADRALLKEMVDRSPGAVLAEAERQLKLRPTDPVALNEKAAVLEKLGEREAELDTHFKLLEVLPESELGPSLSRIEDLGKLGDIPFQRRLTLADRLKATDAGVAALLLVSVLDDDAAQAQRPDVLLSLAALHAESQPEASNPLLRELVERYPLHPAVEIARAKGLI